MQKLFFIITDPEEIEQQMIVNKMVNNVIDCLFLRVRVQYHFYHYIQ